MNLEGRDRKAVIVGAILAVGIVVVGYVILPMKRSWSDDQNRLNTRQNQIATLKGHADSQESLVTRRNVLVLRLGSLFGGGESAEDLNVTAETPPDSPDSESPESKDAPVQETSENEQMTKAEEPPDSEPLESEDAPAQKSSESEQATKAKEPPADEQPAPAKKSPSPRLGSLAGYVEQAAQKAGIKIGRITPRKTSSGRKPGKYFRPVTLQIAVETNPQGLLTMLAALEGGEYLARVNSIQIRRNLKKGDSISATLEIVGYEAVVGT